MATKKARKTDAGQWRTIEVDGIVITEMADSELTHDQLVTLAQMAIERGLKVQILMPLAAISVCAHALAYMRNNPELEGLLKIEADAAFGVFTAIADDMWEDGGAALIALDAEFHRQNYGHEEIQ